MAPGDPDWPADYSAADARYASISWALSVSAVYAVGPHTVDPRTGEILDADIMFAHSWIHYWLRDYDRYTRPIPGADEMDGVGSGGVGSRGVGSQRQDPDGRGQQSRLARRLAAAQRITEILLEEEEEEGEDGAAERGGSGAAGSHAAGRQGSRWDLGGGLDGI